MRLKLFIGTAVLAWLCHSELAQADICDFYKETYPSLYRSLCSGSRRPNSGTPSSSVAESFSINPAQAPTQPSPYGIENISTYLRNGKGLWSPSFAVIKGFRRFGAGISTASDNTFYSNDLDQRMNRKPNLTRFESKPTKTKIPSLSTGTAFELVPPKGNIVGINLGVALRYNNISNRFGYGSGLSLRWGLLNFGVGSLREKVSVELPWLNYSSASVAMNLPFLNVEYIVLKHMGSGGPDLSPIQIVSGTLDFGKVFLTAAVRRLDYRATGLVWQKHFGVQVFFSQHVSAGFLVNYIPGGNSLATQIYL